MKIISTTLFLIWSSSALAFDLPANNDLSTIAEIPARQQEPIRIPDFNSIKDSKIRKQAFIRLITKVARPILHSIEKKRTILLGLYLRYRTGDPLTDSEQQWILRLAKHLELKQFDSEKNSSWIELLKRTDTIPLSLLIAQAAIESAWGTSRFAREGNNYFGIWCSRPGCGIVPKQRAKGANHEVERYPNVTLGIRKYIHILNTRDAFEPLRKLRHQQRVSLLSPTGTMLLRGLDRYAEHGETYMDSLEKIIRQNQLALLD